MSASQPNPISNLTATALSVSEIDLAWTNNNPGFETGATIERTFPGQPTNFQPLATVATGVSSYQDLTVVPGSSYSYRITALPFSSRAFVPAPGVIASATTPGVPPHVYLQSPRLDPIGMQGFIGHKVILDGSWGSFS